MSETYYVRLVSASNKNVRAYIELQNKSVEEIDEEIESAGIYEYLVVDYFVGGCPLEKDATIESMVNIVSLVESEGPQMALYLDALYKHYKGHYNQELDFEPECDEEDDLNGFMERFNHYYKGLFPNDQDDFAIWLYDEDECNFPDLCAAFKAHQNFEEFFNWAKYSKYLIDKKLYWISRADVTCWGDNAQGYYTTHYVFSSFGRNGEYSEYWGIAIN